MTNDISSSIPNWMNYKSGDKNIQGEVIDFVYSQSLAFCIYSVKDMEGMRWELTFELCPNYQKAEALYGINFTRATSLLSKKRKKEFMILLVSDMTEALSFNKVVPVETLFSESTQYLDAFQRDQAHFCYVFSALIFTILSVLPATIYLYSFGKDSIYNILVGLFFGSCGAFVSILQRFQSIKIPRYSTWQNTILSSISRILIGSIFGSLFVISNKSGVVLNIVNTNSFLMYSFAFISGFSERFFPELMDKTKYLLEKTKESELN